jgi:hypothetical protein
MLPLLLLFAAALLAGRSKRGDTSIFDPPPGADRRPQLPARIDGPNTPPPVYDPDRGGLVVPPPRPDAPTGPVVVPPSKPSPAGPPEPPPLIQNPPGSTGDLPNLTRPLGRAGFDPPRAAQLAPRVLADLRRGPQKFTQQAKKQLQAFQAAADLRPVDGVYGGRTAGALAYFATPAGQPLITPPPPWTKDKRVIPYVI